MPGVNGGELDHRISQCTKVDCTAYSLFRGLCPTVEPNRLASEPARSSRSDLDHDGARDIPVSTNGDEPLFLSSARERGRI